MANQVTTTFKINAQGAINSLNAYNTQLERSIKLQRQLGGTAGGGARPPGGGGGGAGGGGGQLGAFSGLGSNLLGPLAGVASFAAAAQAIRASLTAYKEAEAANRALAASALEAGKSYTELAEGSNRFAASAGISQAAAARSTAQLQRLVGLAGQTDQLEKYQQGFLDIAAARGVAFEELDTLFQGIIAGTDDALNRFGKADPSKLAAQYAASIGKTTEQLTEQEKVLSRLKAFEKDFGLFSGANEERINSVSGSMDRFNALWEDTIANFGKFIAESPAVVKSIEAINTALAFYSRGESPTKIVRAPDIELLKDLLKEGVTPEQAAARQFAFDFEQRLRAQGRRPSEELARISRGQADRATALYGDNPEQEARARAAILVRELAATGLITADQARERLQQLAREAKNAIASLEADAQKADEEATKARLANAQRVFDAKKAEFELIARIAQRESSVGEARLRLGTGESLADQLRLNQQIGNIRLQALEDERARRLELFALEKAAEGDFAKRALISEQEYAFTREQNLAVEQERLATLERGLQIEKQIAEGRKQVTRDLRNQILGYAANQNPYVRIFTDAQNALEDLADKTKEFGKRFGRTMVSEIQSQFNLQMLGQDIDNLVKAVSLRQEARQYRGDRDLESLFPGYNISEQIDAAQRAFSRARTEGFGSEAERRAAERRRDQAIIGLTSGLDVQALRGTTYGEAILSDAASAREREADRLERDRNTAQQVFDQVLRQFADGGLRVRLADSEQVVRIINEAPESASVATRPSRGATNGRYGN